MLKRLKSSLQKNTYTAAVKHLCRVFTAVLTVFSVLVCTVPHRVEAAGFGSNGLSTVEFIEWKPVTSEQDNLPKDDKIHYMLLVTKNLYTDRSNAYYMGGDINKHHAAGYSISGNDAIERFFNLDGKSSFITSNGHNLMKIQYAGEESGNGYPGYYVSAYCTGSGRYRYIHDGDDWSDSLSFSDDKQKWGFAPEWYRNSGYSTSCDVDNTVCIYYNDNGGYDTGLMWHWDNHYFYADEDSDYDDFGCFFLWIGTSFTYSALTHDYTVCRSTYGDVLNFDGEVIIKEGVTLTIEPGAVLSVEGNIFNNGIINNYGTIIIQSGASMCPFDVNGSSSCGTINLIGSCYSPSYTCKNGETVSAEGNMIVMENGRVATDYGYGTFSNLGGNMINYGFVSSPGSYYLDVGSVTNYGTMLFGVRVDKLNSLYCTTIGSKAVSGGRYVTLENGSVKKSHLFTGGLCVCIDCSYSGSSFVNYGVIEASSYHNNSYFKKKFNPLVDYSVIQNTGNGTLTYGL